jgi:protein-S-isoprenylcysteine O-methyltransferase Ste14
VSVGAIAPSVEQTDSPNAIASADAASPHRPRRLWITTGNLAFRFRDALLPATLGLLLLTTQASWPGGRRSWDHALDLLGIELAFAGQALRALVIGLAYIRRGGKDRRVHADDLVVDGVFAHCRNPLYVGNLLVLAGLLVIHNSAVAYLIGLPLFTLAYASIVAAEEDYLLCRFGDHYRSYCARVPRFLFSTRGFGATLARFRFDWRRLLRKEYGATFAGASAVLLTLAWDDVQVLGPASLHDSLPWMLMVWVQLMVAYLVVRNLKKSGRLGSG